MAGLKCSDCLKWIIDYDWSEHRGTAKPKGPEGGEPWKRPKHGPPPCNKCPKRSPAEERLHVLSAKNRRTYQLGWKIHSTSGHYLTEAMKRDQLFMDNLAIVLREIRLYERQDLADRIAIKTYGIHRK